MLERAVEARYTELTNEAARLALQAKRTDEAVPGADLFVAEMALRQGDAVAAGTAAQQALHQAHYADDARLILALNTWMLRGEIGTEAAAARSMQLLGEAAEDSLCNSAVRFITGDLQRATGQLDDAHRSLLGGLHRQQIWQSVAVITAKLALSTAELRPDASVVSSVVSEQAEVFGSSVALLRRAQNERADLGPALASVRSIFTQKHVEVLARDPALSALFREDLKHASSVPFGRTMPPGVAGDSAGPVPSR